MTSRRGIRDGHASFADSDARWPASDERSAVVAEVTSAAGLLGSEREREKDDAVFVPEFSRPRARGKRSKGEIETEGGRRKEKERSSRVPRIHEASQCEYRASVNGDILAASETEGRKRETLEVR